MTQNRRSFLKRGALATTLGTAGLAGCTGQGTQNGDEGTSAGAGDLSITVGSRRFAEQEFFSYCSILALEEHTEANIVDETGLGGTNQIWQAFQQGEIDHYWSYTVTTWNAVHGRDSVIADPDEIYNEVTNLFDEQYDDLTVLNATETRADWAIIVRPDWADENGIETLSDFASHIKNGNTDFRFVTYTQFAERADGIPALLDTYDISQSQWDEIDVRKVSMGSLNYQVLDQGEAVATSGWLTQPQIEKYDLRALEDDQGFTSASVIIPFARTEILEGNDVVEDTINDVASVLTTEDVREKVLEISETDISAEEAAREYLTDNDIL